MLKLALRNNRMIRIYEFIKKPFVTRFAYYKKEKRENFIEDYNKCK